MIGLLVVFSNTKSMCLKQYKSLLLATFSVNNIESYNSD